MTTGTCDCRHTTHRIRHPDTGTRHTGCPVPFAWWGGAHAPTPLVTGGRVHRPNPSAGVPLPAHRSPSPGPLGPPPTHQPPVTPVTRGQGTGTRARQPEAGCPRARTPPPPSPQGGRAHIYTSRAAFFAHFPTGHRALPEPVHGGSGACPGGPIFCPPGRVLSVPHFVPNIGDLHGQSGRPTVTGFR